MQQKFIAKCVRFFITKWDSFTTNCTSNYKTRRFYYKMWQLLQNSLVHGLMFLLKQKRLAATLCEIYFGEEIRNCHHQQSFTCSKSTMETPQLCAKSVESLNDVILVFLLLTMKWFHLLYWCFHCWHWISQYRLDLTHI